MPRGSVNSKIEIIMFSPKRSLFETCSTQERSATAPDKILFNLLIWKGADVMSVLVPSSVTSEQEVGLITLLPTFFPRIICQTADVRKVTLLCFSSNYIDCYLKVRIYHNKESNVLQIYTANI